MNRYLLPLLIVASGIVACSSDDTESTTPSNTPTTFAELDRSKAVADYSQDEAKLFCEWITSNDVWALGDPYLNMLSVDTCLALARPDCSLSLYEACVASESADSADCDAYRQCAAVTFPPANPKGCSPPTAQCPDAQSYWCSVRVYTNGSWVETSQVSVVSPCTTDSMDYRCGCYETDPQHTCDPDLKSYSYNGKEGNCYYSTYPTTPEP